MAPADETECRRMLTTAYRHKGPAAVRYPRGNGPGKLPGNALEPLAMGKAEIRRKGQGVAILAFGSRVTAAIEAADSIDATVVNMRFIKPLDQEIITAMASSHDLIVTVEEHAIAGGAGSAVNEALVSNNCNCAVLNLGIPDSFIDHGEHARQLAECGLDADGILAAITAHSAYTQAPATHADIQKVTGSGKV